ncbi:TIGR04372 family glycosyltransferase, partial [Candidatus Pelagibacter sp.]|nr:TIGR04372 family glycosyltransferase [Candidatus Pelagibacter sp.]
KKLLDYLKINKYLYNKFALILFFREFFFKLISLIYLVPGIFLYFLNFRFICTNPFSIGSYSEELECILIKYRKNKYKLILLEPEAYSANKYMIEIFFKDKFLRITSNFKCILLLPFTYLDFLKIDAYKKYDQIYFQKQFFYLNDMERKKKKFDHEILYKRRFISGKTNHLKFENLNKSHNNKKKICFLHVRLEENLELRNGTFSNFIDAIKHLISQNYDVYFFNEYDPRLKLNGFYFFDLNVDINKKKQLEILIQSEFYLGQISGPFFLANFLKKKMIITDLVIFNHLLFSEDYYLITKKFYKNKKLMSLKEIFNDNLQCIWDNKLLIKKNIEVENNTPDEILEVTKEFLNKEKISPKNILSKLESNKIKFNYLNHSILKSLSRYFLEKNKILN